MRIIQKEISLEPMTSRLPSTWIAYYNNDLYLFDNNSLKEREWQYTSNWGMIPFNVVVSPKPSVDTKYDGYSIGCDFILSFGNLGKWYHFFNEYYNLLKNYGHCNRVYTSAEDYYNYESGTKYASQMIYGTDKQVYLDLDSEFASKGGIVEVLVYNKDTSEYMPKTPEEAHDEAKDDRMAMIDVYDVGFFKWICDNVVPCFMIPMKWRDYWKVDRLFYPDVIKWLAWFANRSSKDYESNANFEKGSNKSLKGDVDSWNCKNDSIEDCCDCEEYFNRGGNELYEKLKEWYENVQRNIERNNTDLLSNRFCAEPNMIIPTELQINVDDLGEFSIFSKEYELGTDYRVASATTSFSNTEQGTVASMNGTSMYLEKGIGYAFDDVYMEKYVSSCKTCGYVGVFADKCPKCKSHDITQMSYNTDVKVNEENGWSDYTDKYINDSYKLNDGSTYNNKGDFYVSNIRYFAYDNENVKYFSSKLSLEAAKDDFKDQMSKKYPLTTNEKGWILINGELFPITEIEYATYDESNKYLGNKKYMVFRENFTNTPYTFINGKRIYASFSEDLNKFYFPFFKKDDRYFERNVSGKTMECIYYNDNAYEVTSNPLTINEREYYRISAYTINDMGDAVYLGYDGKILSGNTLEEVKEAEFIKDEECIKVNYQGEIEVYAVDEVNGRTVSKIHDLRLYNVLTDDVGNDIDGIYEINNSSIMNHQPPEGSVLEPIYQVGNTANISPFALTVDDLDSVEGGKNYFVGDIIKEMKFYYKEYDGTIPSATTVDVLLESGDTYSIKIQGKHINTAVTSGYTSLSAITASTSAKTELEKNEDETHVFYDDIFCDITYYKGATLRRKENESHNLCYEAMRNNHGVEYKETVRFVKERREYYLKKPPKEGSAIPTKASGSCSHSVSYPIYVYKLTQTLEHVDSSQYDSSYEVPMADFRTNVNIFINGSGDTYTAKFHDDMTRRNDMQVYPVFREEYRLGMSTIENIDSDIYINRGINAAFEKHLKLGEVTTLEALEQYGNNYFKMIDS